jgi:signal peptidase I
MKPDDDKVFIQDISLNLLATGVPIRVNLGGRSMLPFLKSGDVGTVIPVKPEELAIGDVVMFRNSIKIIAHRIIEIRHHKGKYQIRTKGDSSRHPDQILEGPEILGKLISFEHNGIKHDLLSPHWQRRNIFMARYSGWFRPVYYLYFLLKRLIRKIYSISR